MALSPAINAAEAPIIHISASQYGWNLELTTYGHKPALVAVAVDGNPDRSSYFGDREHIRNLLNQFSHYHAEYGQGWTEQGLEYMQGLCCSVNRPLHGRAPRTFFA